MAWRDQHGDGLPARRDASRAAPGGFGSSPGYSDVLDREAARVSISKQKSYLEDLKIQMEMKRAAAEREKQEERLRSARAEAEAQGSNNFWGGRASGGPSQLRDAAGHVLAPRR
jgi:hypothetical protein